MLFCLLQAALSTRDDEIRRISERLEAGSHLDHLSLVSKSETHEAIILQLHSRLEEAAAKLAQADAAKRHTQSVEAELRDAKQALLVRKSTCTSYLPPCVHHIWSCSIFCSL